jgi:hypothetical protein
MLLILLKANTLLGRAKQVAITCLIVSRKLMIKLSQLKSHGDCRKLVSNLYYPNTLTLCFTYVIHPIILLIQYRHVVDQGALFQIVAAILHS